MLLRKGNYEMTDKDAIVPMYLNMLSTYHVPGISRPWLIVNMARSKTTWPIPSWATQSNVISFNHTYYLENLLCAKF